MTRIIELTIDPQGQSRVETRGFAGDSCRAASRFLETALGRTVGEQLTAEFHQAQTAGEQQRQSS